MKKSLYLKLYEEMRNKIITGAYKYGEKLPSKRTLAEENGVSVITAGHSYELLTDEGYVEAREKSGYYCIFRSEEIFLSSATEITEPVKFKTSNKNVDFPFSTYSKTVRKVLSEYGESILKKSENSGAEILKESLARYINRSRNLSVKSSQIIIGAGAEYLYRLIIDTLGREKIFAIENPSYKQIENVYKANSVNYRLLNLSSDGIDSKALKETDADILHITPYRSFPSGVSASVSKRYEYIRWAAKNNRFIIEDDFESEFSVTKKIVDTVFSLNDNENVIYINTFSRTISAGIRIAFMILPEKILSDFQNKAGFYSCTVPTLEQYVLAELLNSGDFERHINRVRRKLRNR